MSICVLDELRLYLCKDDYYSKDMPSVKEGFLINLINYSSTDAFKIIFINFLIEDS